MNHWLPRAIRSPLRRAVYKVRSTTNYESLYESWAKRLPPETSIGEGNYDQIGMVEVGALQAAGMQPTDTLVDFGCGTGRLALQVIPQLIGGHYIGIDISKTMIRHAQTSLDRKIPTPPCRVDLCVQTTTKFDLPDQSADMICAFSVFTHMEPEDNFRYLQAIRRIVKDTGRFVFSCLPMEMASSRQIFLEQASKDSVERWANVRNFTTSRDMMEEIIKLANWQVVQWYRGDEPSFRTQPTGELHALGQSVCVLKPA